MARVQLLMILQVIRTGCLCSAVTILRNDFEVVPHQSQISSSSEFYNSSADSCPKQCQCSKDKYSVKCQHANLQDVPTGIPQNVRYLYLDFNRIHRLHAKSFADFPHLQRLFLTNNKMTGIDPGAFQGCSKLTKLDLSSNHLASFSNGVFVDLVSLKTIFLQENIMQEIPDISASRNLTTLNMEGNLISAVKLPHGLSSLQSLDLGKNSITTVEEEDFLPLRNSRLTNLFLPSNTLTYIDPKALALLGSIQTLRFNSNPMNSTAIGQAICGLRNAKLQSLKLDKMGFNWDFKIDFFRCLENTSLHDLSISGNQMGIVHPGTFKPLAHLNTINMAGCSLTVFDTLSLPSLKMLHVLRLQGNYLQDFPVGLPPALQDLDLSNNQLKVVNQTNLTILKGLTKLNLAQNKIHQLDENAFLSLKSLQTLDLSFNILASFSTKQFVGLGNLIYLNLQHNNLKAILRQPLLFSYLRSLQKLDLSLNGLESMSLIQFNNLPDLHYLILSGNHFDKIFGNFSERSSTVFKSLPKLNAIDLGSNHLSELPSSLLAGVPSVKYVYLQSNTLAKFPSDALIGLGNLSTLALDYNHISVVSEDDRSLLERTTRIELTGNPFDCGCNLQWFRRWTRKHLDKLIDVKSYRCSSPESMENHYFLDFDPDAISCLLHNDYFKLALYIGIPLICILIIFLFLYCFRLKIQVGYWKCKLQRKRNKRQQQGYASIDDDNFEYDFYLCYLDAPDAPRSKGYEWILANILKPARSSRIFFKETDIRGGQPAMAAMVQSMQRCRSAVVFLCRNFARNDHSLFELCNLLHSQIENVEVRKTYIVAVESIDIGKHVPELLLNYVREGTIAMWDESDADAQQIVLQKLRDWDVIRDEDEDDDEDEDEDSHQGEAESAGRQSPHSVREEYQDFNPRANVEGANNTPGVYHPDDVHMSHAVPDA